ncbi:MAG: AGE family epimerase/isomerase [Caulobacterales bacterium]
MSAPAAVVGARDRLKRWLTHDAYPLWWTRGADQRHGGFFDRLNLDGSPVIGPKRLRVAARQVWAYAQARKLGWGGPSPDAVRHGLRFLAARHRRPDGLYRALVADNGEALEEHADLYDQAFVLLAFAAGAQTLGSDVLGGEAARFRQRLEAFIDPAGGFAESPGQRAPLLANPNMHLFEAFLAWSEVSIDPAWLRLADGQARLAITRLIDPLTGALSEEFGAGWAAPEDAAARQVWPGHLFEWAWLLMRWGATAGRAEGLRAAVRLIEIGEKRGVDPARKVAIFEIDGELEPKDRRARLWSQTERIKACALAARVTGDAVLWSATANACEGLERFLAGLPTPGLWRDWMNLDGGFVEEPAPASSFYHIVSAIAELDTLVGA